MKNYLYSFLFTILFFTNAGAQTPLTSAIDFNVKTLDGEVIDLFPILDQNKIVVVDFFSTSCGPCQTFAYDFQIAYENFGFNQGNVFFLGVNYNGTNEDVRFFDSLFNISLPSASGLDGGGNKVFDSYLVAAYPTVIVIKPDHAIAEQFIWEPSAENIIEAVINAGGLLVGQKENSFSNNDIQIYPNPATSRITLSLELDQQELITIKLKEMSGRLIAIPFENVILEKGINNPEIETGFLPNGMYFVELTIGSSMVIRKLAVRNN
ncbi:MAG: hypothetical protein CVT92_00905 [Bacteroidetes bacterium HGW-Bacteroidetes-1]|jgi:thiol-disulfide isomerase/thioredoxin|nr:MAG: hypothetical protein CVT92_00905 [Bacteroidetes bacterium HGW-Bacteroidetes-1]